MSWLTRDYHLHNLTILPEPPSDSQYLLNATFPALVDIVIPVHNRSEFLIELRESLRAQTYAYWRAIIVDDGSLPDEASKIDEVFKWDNRYEIHHLKHGGPSRARNYAIQRCSSKYIIFHDSDDVSLPNRFERLLYEMERRPECAMLSHQLYEWINDTRKLLHHGLTTGWPELRKLYLQHCHCVCSGVAIYRREVFDEIGMFIPMLDYGEDFEFVTRMVRLGFPIDNLLEPLYLYRKHHNQLSNRSIDEQTKFVQFLTRLYGIEPKNRWVVNA